MSRKNHYKRRGRRSVEQHIAFVYEMRQKLFERDGPFCVYCGCKVIEPIVGDPHQPNLHNHATIDHLIPVCRGGKDNLENLVIACSSCNGKRGNVDAMVFAMYRRGEISKSQFDLYPRYKRKKAQKQQSQKPCKQQRDVTLFVVIAFFFPRFLQECIDCTERGYVLKDGILVPKLKKE